MKSLKNILAGFVIAIISLSGTAFAIQADLNDLSENVPSVLPDKQYVSNAAINAAKLAVEARYQKAIRVQFTVPEEKEVDDIPFDTHKIAMEALQQRALAQVFTVPEEKEVDDIPFDTYKIAMKAIRQRTINKSFDVALYKEVPVISLSMDKGFLFFF